MDPVNHSTAAIAFPSTEFLPWCKPVVFAAALAVMWTWESWSPLVMGRPQRWRHAGRNLSIALINTGLVSLLFAAVTVATIGWTAERQYGLLPALGLPPLWRGIAAIVLLDAWLYVWHRWNHASPLLWRFHRMHHSDGDMDVTTASRFHLGELVASAMLRLALIPLLGLQLPELLVFDSLVVAATMFHHANVSIGRWDGPMSRLLVTPGLHRVHHSADVVETNSNYSVILSIWDRLFGSLRQPVGPWPVKLGLHEFADDRWQSMTGMLITPWATPAMPWGSTRADSAAGQASSSGKAEVVESRSPQSESA
jgi:sterol desaturase/sphingolipid hydroxylase (fatty acid hydroxylase superfamily)